MTDRNGRRVLDARGRPIMSREYDFDLADGRRIAIQDHSAGHTFGLPGTAGNQGPHFNVRENPQLRRGHPTGTQEHYPFGNH